MDDSDIFLALFIVVYHLSFSRGVDALTDTLDKVAVEALVRQELVRVENRILAQRGRNDSRWLSIGTLLILFLFSAVALFGVALTQQAFFDYLLAWLTGTPLPEISGAVTASSGTAAPAASDASSFSQFMTLFLAISAGGIAYLASAMGMKRLERYDEQFQLFRTESQSFADRIDQKFEKSELELSDRLRNNARSFFEEVKLETSKSFASELELAKTSIISMIDEVNKTKEDLKESFSSFFSETDIVSILTDNPSAGEVHDKVTSYFIKGDNDKARLFVRAVLAARNQTTGRLTTTGDLNDWFNLSAELGRRDEFMLALQATLAGLAQQGMVPTAVIDTLVLDDVSRAKFANVDLVAHGILYATKIGASDLVKKLLQIAKQTDETTRNWRYYQFIGDYYAERGNKVEFDKVVDEFRRRLPSDERGDSMQLAWHQARENYDEIEAIAADWLPPSQKRGSAEPLRLAGIYLDRGEYDKVLQLTTRALEGSSESQPSGSIGAMIFYRANAYDALFVRATQAVPIDCGELDRLYQNALRLYQSDLFDGMSPMMRASADKRVSAMQLLYMETGCPMPNSASQTFNATMDIKEAAKIVDQAIKAHLSGDMDKFAKLAAQLDRLRGNDRRVIFMSLIAAANDDDHSDEVKEAAAELARRLQDEDE